MSKDFIDFQTFSDFWKIFEFFIMLKVSSQVALKNFLWLQKLCSEYLGASTTSGLHNARWIKVIACVEQKRRNENEAHLMSKDFIDFSKSQRNFTFLIILKASSQVALKNFLWLQKRCSKYLGASKTSGLHNARWINIIEGVERKIRKENWFFFKFYHPLEL